MVGLTGLAPEAASTWPWLAELIRELIGELRQLKAESVFLLLRVSSELSTVPFSEDNPGGDINIFTLSLKSVTLSLKSNDSRNIVRN